MDTPVRCRAFKGLAYKRYHHVPIYLEWAPKDIFRADAPKQHRPHIADSKQQPVAGNAVAVVPEPMAYPEAEDVESSTIYVKNLAWATGTASRRRP